MKKLNKICCLLLISVFMFSFVACSPKSSEDSKAESVITEYINAYYTITKDDIELYRRIVGGNKDANVLISDTNKANEKFKNLMTDTAYATIIAKRMSYGRCKEASDNNYYVTVKNIKLEKSSEDTQSKVYYYDIDLTQTSLSGNEVKSVKDKRQIVVSKVKDSWKVSNAYMDGY
jgi:hypothetical protein